MPKHIAIDIRCLQTPSPTGVSVYARELLTALFKIDNSNQYYLFTNSKTKPPALPWHGTNIRYLHTRWPNKIVNTLIAAGLFPSLDYYLIKKFALPIKKFDCFFSPNLNFTRLSPDTKSILTIHDLSFELFPHFFSHKQRWWHTAIRPRQQVERADCILAVSEHTKRDLIKYYGAPTDKILVAYPGLPAAFFRIAEKEQLDTVIKQYNLPNNFALFVGTIEPRKNSAALINAFEQYISLELKNAPPSTTPLHLVLAGPPGYRYNALKNIIAKSSAKHRIMHLGYISEADKAALYRAASVFIYPSFYEGFGFPVLEALSQGTPVIASNRTSLPEVAGSAALLINPHARGDIATALKTIYLNKKITTWLNEAGKQQSARFNFENCAQILLTEFNR